MSNAGDDISEYERLRLQKIEENRKCLLELGLLSSAPSPKSNLEELSGKSTPKSAKKRRQSTATPIPVRRIVTRRSVQLGDQYQHEHIEDDDDSQEAAAPPSKKREYRENFYGAVPGVNIGDCWEYRLDCSNAGIHRPTVAGIHGGPDGAYSIALSGGYEDDIDYGDHFTYTGSGGRDLKGTKANPKNLRTAPQTKDQTPDGYNAALIGSVRTQNPVRVIRGYKLNSLYAPESGYRYDGLYTVDKYWTEIGVAGFLVYKFSVSRMKDQEPSVWELEINQENSEQHINRQKTPNTPAYSTSSPGVKNTDLKVNSPSKKSSQVVDSCVSDLNQTNGSLNGSPSIETVKTPKVSDSSPKVGSESHKNGELPTKIQTKSSQSLNSRSQKISTGKKVGIVSEKSKSPTKYVSLIKGRDSIHRYFTTVSLPKIVSPKGTSLHSSSNSHSLSNTEARDKILPPPISSPSQVTGKIVEPLKVNGLKTPSGVENGLNGKKFSPSKVAQSPIAKSPIKISPHSDFKSQSNGVSLKVKCSLSAASPDKVSSPAKSLKKKESPAYTITNELNHPGCPKKGSQEKKEVTAVVSPSDVAQSQNVKSPIKISQPLDFKSPNNGVSPAKSLKKKESPAFKSTTKHPRSSEKASQEKKEVKNTSPACSKVKSMCEDRISHRRALFNGGSSPSKTPNPSPNKQGSNNSPSSKNANLESSPRAKGTRSSPASPSKMFGSPKKLKAADNKHSPGNSNILNVEEFFNSSKSPPSSDQKKGKLSNTLDRYLVKKFASNDFSRASRVDFRKVDRSNDFDSDDESTPAFIGFNEITTNNARNRLKLLSDFLPSIVRKQTYKTKLKQFKKTRKTEELTRNSSSKREFITSIDKIRDLSVKISNMSKFDPNAGFIPECFVKCSKIGSNGSGVSDEEKQVNRKEPVVGNVFFFGESSGDSFSSDSSVLKKAVSPQKLLDLISSDEENDEPFLGFNDVSTRSIVRNGFLIQKYAKIFNKN